ncbi:transposase [Prevotella veroralis]|uniref:transposase n=2 Tax=Prevotella veroralis TaxID=28137 RepID=UPI003D15F584
MKPNATSLTLYMDFPVQVQRCIYTTNWIERLNRKYMSIHYHVFPSSTNNLFPYQSLFINYFHVTQN